MYTRGKFAENYSGTELRLPASQPADDAIADNVVADAVLVCRATVYGEKLRERRTGERRSLIGMIRWQTQTIDAFVLFLLSPFSRSKQEHRLLLVQCIAFERQSRRAMFERVQR